MMTLEDWQAIGIVCGAILALAGVLLLAGKGMGMLWDWRFGRDIKASLQRLEAAMSEMKEDVVAEIRDEQERQAAWQAEHSLLHGIPVPAPRNGNGGVAGITARHRRAS
jgi:hypothetical protein